MALGAREAVFEAGLRIPEDIALVGFDDIRMAALTGIELTTVAHKQYQMGARGAELLMAKLAAPDGATPPQNVVLDAELVVRKTCGFGLGGYVR